MQKSLFIALLSLVLVLFLIGCEDLSNHPDIPETNNIAQTEVTQMTMDTMTEETTIEESAGVSSADTSTNPGNSDNEAEISDNLATDNPNQDNSVCPSTTPEIIGPSVDTTPEKDSTNGSMKNSTDETEGDLGCYDSVTEGSMPEVQDKDIQESEPSCETAPSEGPLAEEPGVDEIVAPSDETSNTSDDAEKESVSDEDANKGPAPGDGGIILPDDEW